MSKKIVLFLLVSILAFGTVMTGCTKKSENKSKAETSATEPSGDLSSDGKKVLTRYFDSMTKGKNPLFGTWQINGMDFIDFTLRNNDTASMSMGTEAYFSAFSFDKKAKTLELKFPGFLQGKYNYVLSKDNKKLTLDLVDNQSDQGIILEKKSSGEFIPDAPKSPVVDDNLLGWWKGDNGQIYYFSNDGIMYSNNISMETCYTYNAADCKIQATYNMDGETKIDIEYSYADGVLTLDDNDYKQFDPFED